MWYVVEMLGNHRLRTVGLYRTLAPAQKYAMRHSRHCGCDVEIQDEVGRTIDTVHASDDRGQP